MLVSNLYLKTANRTRSCGCLQSERAAATNIQRAKHAMYAHPHYNRWSGVINRCQNPADAKYPSYGGRGITVCAEWQDVTKFISFLENVLGPRPPGCTLDRIDNNGNYEPGNVRWADPLTQRHNQRRMVKT